MIATSISTRSVVFAYLIGPPRILSREQGTKVWDSVCGALGVDDLTFKYSLLPSNSDPSSEPKHGGARGFAIQMERQLGRGAFKVTLDNKGMAVPVRLLMEYNWPPSTKNLDEDFDATADAVFTSLGDGWQRVLAEARIRGQVDAGNLAGVEFLVDRALQLNQGALGRLDAPPNFASILIESPAGEPSDQDPLAHPKREGKIEVLKEDPRSLYVELVSQWPQLAIAPTSGVVSVDAHRIRQFTSAPSAYVQNGLAYLNDNFLPLFLSGAEDTPS